MNIIHINANGITRENGNSDGHLAIAGTVDGVARVLHTHLDTLRDAVQAFSLEEKLILRCYFAILDAAAVTLAQKKAALEDKDWKV